MLRDEERHIDGAVLKLLDRFLHDGGSAFFGRDVRAVTRELELLKRLVENGPTLARSKRTVETVRPRSSAVMRVRPA